MLTKFLICPLLLLFVLAQLASCRRGKIINIFSQDAGEDIAEMRDKGNYTVMFHALRQRPVVRKWKIDADGVVAIPYTFRNMNEYEDYEIAAVYDAMWRIGNNTCIHFKERTEERDYVEIKNDFNQGCYASVGHTYGKGVVQLEANDWSTCMVPHVVLHELMHVIGLYHEHMRNDRDDYITVNYTNIPRGYWSQFAKVAQPVVFTSVPYDYKSILHYDKTAFSHDGRSTTMTTNDPAYQEVIGKQTDASPSDYKKICVMYGCSKCMEKNGESIKTSSMIDAEATKTASASLPQLPSDRGSSPAPPFQPSNLSGNPNKLLQTGLCLLLLWLL